MLQVLLPLLLGSAMTGGMVFGGQKLAQGQQRRKEAKEGAAYEKAKANPGVTKAPTAGQPTPQAGQEQPDPMQEAMQSIILGRPVALPGTPLNPPVAKRTYDPVVFTKSRIPRPDHEGGGYLEVVPNEGGYFEASTTAHRAHYDKQVRDGTMTQQVADLKAAIGAEYATAREFGRAPRLEMIRNLTKDQHDIENQFVSALHAIDEWTTMGLPWTDVPAKLAAEEIYIPPEVLDRIQEFLINKYRTWGAKNIHDPAQLDSYERGVQNRFGVPSRPPVARVENLDPKIQAELAQRGVAPSTPISSAGQGSLGYSDVEAAQESYRYHQRPRIGELQTVNLGGTKNLIMGGIAPMMEIMNRRRGADMTGPFDPLKQKFDQWGTPFLSDQDRVALRGYQDQLYEVLYKMRGKQLAVAEIAKAKNLMPDVGLDEEAFVTQLDVFTNYIMNTAMGNLATMHRVGIDIGGAVEDVIEYEGLRDEYGGRLMFDYRGPYVKDEKTGEKLRIVPAGE